MRIKTCYVLVIIVIMSFSLYMVPSVTAASAEEEVLQVSRNFVKAFNTGDMALMSSLHWHSPNLTKFTPDKTGAFLAQGWATIESDWQSTLGLPKGTWVISSHNPQITLLGDEVGVIAEYFIMTINPPAEKEQTIIQIRHTLVVQRIGGKWLIVHEHASLFPAE